MKILSKWAAVLLLVIVAATAGCGAAQEGSSDGGAAAVGTVIKTDKGQYTDITPAQLNAMMANKDFFLVDVHVPHEGAMPQLDARIKFDEIDKHLDELPQDKASKIVLICKSGGMSTESSKTLADLGYTNVFNLAGGFVAWQSEGYPLTPEPK